MLSKLHIASLLTKSHNKPNSLVKRLGALP